MASRVTATLYVICSSAHRQRVSDPLGIVTAAERVGKRERRGAGIVEGRKRGEEIAERDAPAQREGVGSVVNGALYEGDAAKRCGLTPKTT